MSKKILIWRIFSYIIFAIAASFVIYKISGGVIEGRKGNYQNKYINKYYENLEHEKYLIESVGLQKGIIDIEPINTLTIDKTNYNIDDINNKKLKSYLELTLKIYRVAFPIKKGKYDFGYVFYFEKASHFILEKDEYKEYDITYRGELNDPDNKNNPSIFSKNFNKDSLLAHQFEVSFVFDKDPLILKNKDDKKNKNFTSTILNPAIPILFTDQSLLLEKNKEDVATLKSIYISELVKNNEGNNDNIPVCSFKEDDGKSDFGATNKNLNLSKNKYHFEDKIKDVKKLEKVYDKKAKKTNPIEGIDTTSGLYQVNINKALNEFNTKPILIITGISLLVLLASYFLFAHKYVIKIIKEKISLKKTNNVANYEGKKIDNVQDIEAKEISEEPVEKSIETKEEKN